MIDHFGELVEVDRRLRRGSELASLLSLLVPEPRSAGVLRGDTPNRRALWGDRDRLVPLAHRNGVMTAFPQAQVSVWKNMGHHPQRERPSELARFIEAACNRARPSARHPATGSKPRRTRVLAVRFTPHPLAAGVGELPPVGPVLGSVSPGAK